MSFNIGHLMNKYKATYYENFQICRDLKAMLRRGLELLEMYGQLVYTTTSLNPIENEAVVAALLKEAPRMLSLFM